jgi:hypothetical protein
LSAAASWHGAYREGVLDASVHVSAPLPVVQCRGLPTLAIIAASWFGQQRWYSSSPGSVWQHDGVVTGLSIQLFVALVSASCVRL